MNTKNTKNIILCLIVFLFLFQDMTFPQSSQNFKLKNYVIDMSGQSTSSLNFKLVATIGQPSAIGSSDGKYFRLSAGFLAQERGTINVVKTDEVNIPFTFYLNQNYPNPFNPTTTIDFGIAKSCQVKMRIWNVLGQLVAEPIDKHYEAGCYRIIFDAKNLVSGVYFYRITTDDFVEIKKMVLTR
jgi:hypothetical protein